MGDLGSILTGSILAVLISLMLITIFIVMAVNVAHIKRELTDSLPKEIHRKTNSNIYLAEREEWKGNKQQAVEYYLNLLYDLKNSNSFSLRGKTNASSKEFVEKKIKELGGEMPKTGLTI